MERAANFILKHRKAVLIMFLVLTAICVLLFPLVGVNYDMSEYLPDSAPSTQAIKVMKEEYGTAIPSAEVMLPPMSLAEARQKKAELEQLSFVTEVNWLDDLVDLAQPLAMTDPELIDTYYKDKQPLFLVTVDDGYSNVTMQQYLHDFAGEEGAVRGQIISMARAQISVQTEITRIMAIAVPIALIILVIATRTWLEPLLFMTVLFVGVMLNMGTNIIFGEISFITQSVAAILQLAVSIDYAIFMLHRFDEYHAQGYGPFVAMCMAMVKAASSITASALTTFFGFLALVFMRFKIGPDLGFVLAKGIVFSLVSVMFLLPVLILMTWKLLAKTRHRSFLPSFKGFSKFVYKIRIPVMILVLTLALPFFLAQRKNHFLYGMDSYPADSREYAETQKIEDVYGLSTQMALLVPRGDWDRETALMSELESLDRIDSVFGYSSAAGVTVPPAFLPPKDRAQLLSDNYSRLILVSDVKTESAPSFALVETIREKTESYYGDNYHLIGENATLADMRDMISRDNVIVNGLAILAVGLVVALVFRSIAIPLILLLTIEAAIWLNLAIPYLQGKELNFIGYLVISTVQLGATVDYGILLSQYYLDHRKTLLPREAAMQSVADTAGSLVSPALILAGVSFTLMGVSTIAVVKELGLVLGRGALISLGMVLFFLPGMLVLLDSPIEKTTMNTSFLPKPHRKSRQSQNTDITDTLER
ncbi:MAG: efflux RND transporter permease subunit [Saccharofermentanales bacterium]